MEEYLAFINEIGRSINGQYTYCFYFTYNKEVVWGEYYNICPCSIIPNLKPDEKTLSHKINIDFDEKLILAKNNMCFSMQDCIDGIIPLAFTDIYNDKPILYKGKPLYFPYGEDKESVIEKCKEVNALLGEIQDVIVDNGDKDIDSIIDNIGNDDNDEFDDIDF